MTVGDAWRRLIEGKTREDRELRVGIVVSVIILGLWIGASLAAIM